MNKEAIEIKKRIAHILMKNKVKKAGLFGSFARGEQNKDSDIDILVEIKDNRSLTELIGLKLVLEKSLKRKVDLVEYGTIRQELKNSILRDEIQLL